MGKIPIDRLKAAPPFNVSMLDLFGPYKVKGEVQKRTTGNAYGVLSTDLVSRAVHIEPVFGYDTESFLLALSRFTSLRGWPSKIYSDPGSQLIGSEKEVLAVWANIDKTSLYKCGTENGLTWEFGPADSPWNQGAVEVLVKAAKRGIRYALNNHTLTPSQFITVCYDIANQLNERPLGTLPSHDSEINLFTPNCLLLGRALSQNPGGFTNTASMNLSLRLVEEVTGKFWDKWVELYAPSMAKQQKWYKGDRQLKVGDIVLITDSNTLRGHYYPAVVREVFASKDGKVRKVMLAYKNFRVGEKVHEYKGVHDTQVCRSVRKLALLVPIDSPDTI
jgi:hypothetical protein